MKNALLLFFAAFPLSLLAQQKDIYDTAAEKMCDYLKQHTEVKITSEKDAENFFSQAFLETCMPLADKLIAKEGMTTFDSDAGQLIGRKVGLKLAVICPKYLEIMRPVLGDRIQKDEEAATGTLRGTVVQVTQDGYTYVKLKTADGTQKKLVWLTAFDDAENFNNDVQLLLNKKLEVRWRASQLYYFKSKTFGTEKIITGVKTY